MKNISYTILTIITIITFYSCKKDFLNEKPSSSIVQPTTLDEFQSLLDNSNTNNVSTGLGILASDDYVYYSDAIWQSARTATERNSYIWAKDLFEGEISDDWNKPYTAIFYANNVLAGLERIQVNSLNNIQWNQIKGWSLFVRAFAYYELIDNFASPYDAMTASTDMGVPLRLNPSIDELLQRSSVKETFDRIITDLTEAGELLSTSLPLANRNRPSKVAVHALLARIYVTMRDYTKAEQHADACLQLYNKLIDYNTLSKTANAPFSTTNDELIYAKSAAIKASYGSINTFTKIAPELIKLYSANDLRLVIFFVKQTDGSYRTKRAYHGNGLYPFVGLATDEVFLIKAECLARRGETNTSMDFINKLLGRRWNSNATTPAIPYQNVVAANPQEALDKILLERRKELVWRGLRWSDLRRLNKEGANISLTRTVNGVVHTLTPNDPKYVFPIPDNEIALSGIQQNLR
ncbi:RagB/SusD family nutrient uptake outer membrane protein [Pedobacter panaciterrae]|uniref:RagB/SusD family nutrient uptake outer membrane protein n=1 Tax=Pedobacter panaciterrae TaxID=363849 RepID=A0ABU8NHG7_9SPHI